jgi:hypothetical protein
MINSLPQCAKCGSHVTDSIESEIEQHGKIKTGNYINGEWICNDCLGAEKKEKEEIPHCIQIKITIAILNAMT